MKVPRNIITSLLIVIVFGLLCRDLPDSFQWFDSGEFVASAVSLGVSHNPGYPIYNTVANGFQRMFPFGSVAYRLNLLSLIMMILTFLILGISLEILRKQELRTSPFPAFAWVIIGFYLTPILREQALMNEVYTFDLLFLSLNIFAALRLRQKPDLRRFFFFIFIASLAVINHYSAVLWLPGVMLLLPRTTWSYLRAFFPGAVLFGLLASSILIYLPIRSQNDPAVNWNSPKTIQSFTRHVTAQDHRATSIVKLTQKQRFDRLVEFLKILKGQYSIFVWFGISVLIAAAIYSGSYLFVACLVIAFGHTLYAVYLNVVPFIATPFGLPLLIALIVVSSFSIDHFAQYHRYASFLFIVLIIVLFLIFPAAPLSLSGNTPRILAHAILDSCDENAVLIPYSDTYTFTVSALQASEKYRTDVIIIPEQYPLIRPFGDIPAKENPLIHQCLSQVSTAGLIEFAMCLSQPGTGHLSIFTELRPDIALKLGRLFSVRGPLWKFSPGHTIPDLTVQAHMFSDFFSSGFDDEVSSEIAATSLNTLGLYLQNLQQFDEARRMYLHVLDVQPRFSDAMINLGILATQIGDTISAMEWMERAITVDNNSAQAMKNLGILAWRIGDTRNSILWLERAALSAPSDESIRQELQKRRQLLESGSQ